MLCGSEHQAIPKTTAHLNCHCCFLPDSDTSLKFNGGMKLCGPDLGRYTMPSVMSSTPPVNLERVKESLGS